VNQTNAAPMSFSKSLLFFGMPYVMFMIAIYIVVPALHQANVPLFGILLVALGVPMALLIGSSIVAYRLEGGSWTWSAFKSRFRLEPMRRAAWLWTLGLSILMFLAPGFLSFSSDLIQQIAPIPDTLARMFEIDVSTFMGMPLAGAWWIAVGYLAYVILNVFGEELWWRGYILPRQEMSLGIWTWLVHGVLWNLFHSFFYWELILWLPGCLALSYVAQRSKNTWPGIIAHLSYSIPGLIVILIGVLR
jgi:membrane protease YdiL (CAAX protease family)